MSSSRYKVLLKAIELKSINKAAKELGYTQSGVSHIIQNLEQEFGVQLVTRTNAGVRWNPTGESLAPYIQAICDSETRLFSRLEEITSLSGGRVCVGAFLSISSFILPRFIAQFSEAHPDLDVVIRVGEYQELESWLLTGDVDFIFTIIPTDKQFHTIEFMEDELRVVLPQGHPLVAYNRIPLSKMRDYPYILLDYGNNRDCAGIPGYDELAEHAKYTVKEDATTLSMVESGLGLSLLVKLISDQYHHSVVYRSLEPPHFRTIVLAYPEDAKPSPAAQLFVDEFLTFMEDRNA